MQLGLLGACEILGVSLGLSWFVYAACSQEGFRINKIVNSSVRIVYLDGNSCFAMSPR